jgi:hypothetical protein
VVLFRRPHSKVRLVALLKTLMVLVLMMGLYSVARQASAVVQSGFIPSGTASNGLPVLPAPTAETEDFDIVKRFEGPRGKGPNKPWHHYKPRPTNPSRPSDAPQPPPVATGGPVPSGTQGPPGSFPTGGPFPPGPTAL